MTILVIIEKTGSLKEQSVKDLTRDIIYKKCNFRKKDGFDLRNAWLVKDKDVHIVELWSRDSGKSGTENKYELPPPIDTPLYFGNMAAVGVNNKGELVDLTVNTWKRVYDKLFGGFEDLGDEDSEEESEDELDDIPDDQKTKNGYLKDGFVVDKDDEDDEDEESFESEEEESASETDSLDDDEDDEEMEFDDGSELVEEDYYYSDDDEDDGKKKKSN